MSTSGAPLRAGDRQRLADSYTLLSRCFQQPDEEFVTAVQSGRFGTELADRLDRFGVDSWSPPPEEPADFWAAYMRTFEAYEGAHAPPVESVYEEWWDGTERELLSGPPAQDMRRRYEAQGLEIPAAYPADHVSLLLEYGSVLLEAGADEAYLAFHEQHFGWIPAFRERVAETCEDPFYSWAVETLATVLELTRSELQ